MTEAAAFADLLSGPDSDAEEEERREEAALDGDLEEEALPGAPWMTRQSRGLFPDWAGALWSLGRALRRLVGLQVLVADVECPARGQQGERLGAGLEGAAVEGERNGRSEWVPGWLKCWRVPVAGCVGFV